MGWDTLKCPLIILFLFLYFCLSNLSEIQDVLGKIIVTLSLDSIPSNELKKLLALFKVEDINKVLFQYIFILFALIDCMTLVNVNYENFMISIWFIFLNGHGFFVDDQLFLIEINFVH